MQLQPNFHFLEVAYPYVARRLLTDEDPALRERLFQVSPLHLSFLLLCLAQEVWPVFRVSFPIPTLPAEQTRSMAPSLALQSCS